MKKLLVIDGNSILNRQFYGIRPLTTAEGLFTNAVYGFVNVLLSELETIKPDFAAIAFDVHAPTFRHEKYSEYKAGRRSTPPELLSQFPYAKECAKALGITVIEKAGFEADDILGTLAKTANDEGVFAYVLTGDRDSLQLINDNTHVLLATNVSTVTFDNAAFKEKYGVEPWQFVDMKAIMGDSSDNIPGVAGIGEKGASKLISQYGSLDGVYENIDSMKPSKQVEYLRVGKESAYLSQFLARIVVDAPIDVTLEDVRKQDQDNDALLGLFTKLEFSGFIKRLSLDKKSVDTPVALSVSARELADLPLATTCAIRVGDGVISLADDEHFYKVDCQLSDIKDVLSSHKFCVYDYKSLCHELSNVGIPAVECTFDVLLAAYVLNPSESKYEIDRLCTTYLGAASEGAKAVWLLADVMSGKLDELDMTHLYRDIEMPLSKVLFDMEERGMLIDSKGLLDFSAELDESIRIDAQKIYELAGHDFNISSPKQLGIVLFEELGLPFAKKTKSGFSTSADILDKLRPYHPIIDLILDYRQLTKLKSTYADGLPAAASADGRVRTSFNQTVTATGRLSSTEPNLQNIPIRTELGRRMRKYFVAKDGYTLVDADYSQIELRLLAHISGDPIMIDAFCREEDIHTITASQVFGVDIDDVTPELRKRAKAVNFGIVYGIGDYSLSQDLGIQKWQAAEYIKAYKAKYRGVDEYLSAVVEQAYRDGYVTTLLGRRRYIPELSAPQAMMRSFGERVAMNSPIQGTAADIIKIAMIEVEKALAESGIDAKLIMQVHDELIIEARRSDAEAAAAILKEKMEGAMKLSVPLSVDVGIGDTWFDCH